MNKERVALVTGASAGIGEAIAKRLAREGLRVFGTSRNPQKAEAIDGVQMLPLDVRSDESVKACIESVLAKGGRLDILANNAGYILTGAAEEVSLVEAEESGTRLRWTGQMMMKGFARLFEPIIASQMRSQIDQQFSVLPRIIESEIAE